MFSLLYLKQFDQHKHNAYRCRHSDSFVLNFFLLDKTSKPLLSLHFIINLIMENLTLKNNLQIERGKLYMTSKEEHAHNCNQSSLNSVL